MMYVQINSVSLAEYHFGTFNYNIMWLILKTTYRSVKDNAMCSAVKLFKTIYSILGKLAVTTI